MLIFVFIISSQSLPEYDLFFNFLIDPIQTLFTSNY